MFETIKEFEDYIFSIETEEQLQHAKFGEADVLAYMKVWVTGHELKFIKIYL